jgi:hypothetical protein
MCTGFTFILTCGHTQARFHTRCGKNCRLPSGLEYTIPDTCPDCYVSREVGEILKAHKETRWGNKTRAAAAEQRDGRPSGERK